MWRTILMWSLLASLAEAETHKTGSADTNHDELQQAWQEKLDRFPARFNGFWNPDVMESLKRYKGDQQIHLIYDPKKKGQLVFRFVDNGREVISIRGHRHTSFQSADGKLFFAEYLSFAPGCIVRAFDLRDGKELWKTKLHHAQPRGASGYSNRVQLSIRLGLKIPGSEVRSKEVLWIRGTESYCDYIEVLDPDSGKSLALRQYRVGFGNQEEEDKDPNESSIQSTIK